MNQVGEKTRLNRAFSLAAAAIGGLWLLFIWHRNYNLLGEFYDYSIVTSAGGYLHAGLKPYRDFGTPLQSLTIYLCYFAELIFGHRYLALAYANLVLGLGFYLIMLWFLRGRLPPLLGVLTAAALTVATVFQQGVLWYNSIATVLMTLMVCGAAILYQQRRISALLGWICALLFLSSMCKINFHALAFALVCGILALLFFRLDGGDRKVLLKYVPVLLLAAFVLGPVVEVLVNGITFHQFVDNVMKTPTGRLKAFYWLLDPALYLGTLSSRPYPDDWSGGIFLNSFLVYGICAYLAMFKSEKMAQAQISGTGLFSLKYLAPIMLLVSFFISLVLTVTNIDTEFLTDSFLVTGLVATLIMFQDGMTSLQSFGFKAGIFLLSACFFVAGSASAFMHSRVRLTEHGWTLTMIDAMLQKRQLSALKDAVPFYNAESISQTLTPYFGGVHFTELARSRLARITAFMEKNDLNSHPQKVYWGPGLEILNRVYGTVPAGHLPLWYHLGVSVRNDDGPRIVETLKKDDFEWIVIPTRWTKNLPSAVSDYINSDYEKLEDDDLQIFHRRHSSADMSYQSARSVSEMRQN